MKYLLISLLFFSCVESKKKIAPAPSLEGFSKESSQKLEDDFSDFKKKDESCDSEEEVQKKIEEKLKKEPTKAFKLQGGEPDCAIDGSTTE